MIDKIIVTGSSDSTGMEMVDHLLDYNILRNRKASIWKWYKKNYQNLSSGLPVDQLNKISNEAFHKLEREHSWPSLLEKETGIKVINLAIIGSSIGRNLIEFSNYCNQNKIKPKTIAIHQLPEPSRFYLRFNGQRINVLASDNFNNKLEELHYDKKFFKEDIKKLKEKYEKIIKKDLSRNYIENYYYKCLERIKKISKSFGIENFFISRKEINVENSIIKDFIHFRNKYKLGVQHHPIEPKFNKDLVDIIRSKLSI